MYKDRIITLDNGLEYMILTDLNMDNRMFILGAMVDVENDLVDDKDLLVKEIITIDGKDKVVNINDRQEAEKYTKLLLEKAHEESLKVD